MQKNYREIYMKLKAVPVSFLILVICVLSLSLSLFFFLIWPGQRFSNFIVFSPPSESA